ncbi:MAG: hypothetical protein ABH814_01055 [bacterium]
MEWLFAPALPPSLQISQIWCTVVELVKSCKKRKELQMYRLSTHEIGEDFVESARAAIKTAIVRDGEAPNYVVVRPGTTELPYIAVGIGSPATFYTIPVQTGEYAEHIGIEPGFFGLDVSHGALE